ncbi:DUF1801 domain-containing protein [Marinigracilibium pacificum]|uniref:DUF1801 domain-containing protein n=1 Tax=Marinigracilibium pacificum TaxID=2729599 RepID=A0A848IZC8_9BACT|nr:DUF1801 domain-containing protein [Marinigracilibium pacificum]NMM47349.1 DUF1801 domain-containing protein [Marinigracilibium pacificum]
MSDLKTKPNSQSVEEFLNKVENEKKKQDSLILLQIMKEITNAEPKMWGDSIVGFGQYHYKYQSGREGDWFITGFSPRKQNLTIYIMDGFKKYQTLLDVIGKFKTGSSCLYINKIDDIDLEVLKTMISKSYKNMQEKYN